MHNWIYSFSFPISFSGIGKWLGNIEQFGMPGVPLILLGNKVDLEDKREVTSPFVSIPLDSNKSAKVSPKDVFTLWRNLEFLYFSRRQFFILEDKQCRKNVEYNDLDEIFINPFLYSFFWKQQFHDKQPPYWNLSHDPHGIQPEQPGTQVQSAHHGGAGATREGRASCAPTFDGFHGDQRSHWG